MYDGMEGSRSSLSCLSNSCRKKVNIGADEQEVSSHDPFRERIL